MSSQDDSNNSRFLSKVILFAVPAVVALVLFAQLFGLIEPWLWPLHLVQGRARKIEPNIIIGPYPHARDFPRLKAQSDVVEVISLLSPNVPGENQLLAGERQEAKTAGVKFSSYPLSFVSLHSRANKRQAKRVAKYVLAKYGSGAKGKIYIHCYLGRHRVGLVEEAIKLAMADSHRVRQVKY